MKSKINILICLTISCVLFSCKTQPSLHSYFDEKELRELRERNQAIAEAYLQDLENSHPDSVTMLCFDATYLDTFPDFSKYNKVCWISFAGIRTKKVDKSLFASDSLKNVTLTGCCFRKIDFLEGNHIERLSLTNCYLTRIPSSIRQCKHLKALNLDGNQIRHIPRWIMELDSLEEITLNYNQLRLTKADIRHLSKAKQIVIGGNGFEKLPNNIGQLRCESLNLGKNKLHSLPPSFGQLTQLKHVIFYENEFTEIPEVLANCNELRHLDFYKNNLTEIPDFVGNLKDLGQLFLSYNKIEVIPDTLRNLKRLKYFYIHHNELHFLPAWLPEMDSLERIGVGYNHLLELPDLAKIQSLKELDCEHNLLERFPWELVEKPDMELLILRDNDFNLSQEEKKRLIKACKNINIVY